ncbi:MAG: hypothetical protein KME42_08605 [Tildeniella nuda ZEHNDER 1965/U140]|jgi:hypothetical protein|nr:hypothetical protein [Tildeniella nuda ZEHNDER 1965/U140]
MTQYIEFKTADNSTFLIEVDTAETLPSKGVAKAGLKEKVQSAVATAQTTFEKAVEEVVKHNVQAFINSMRSLSDPPTEVEISFGLKATGEAGNIAIGKLGSEMNYSVKLAWKPEHKSQQ